MGLIVVMGREVLMVVVVVFLVVVFLVVGVSVYGCKGLVCIKELKEDGCNKIISDLFMV